MQTKWVICHLNWVLNNKYKLAEWGGVWEEQFKQRGQHKPNVCREWRGPLYQKGRLEVIGDQTGRVENSVDDRKSLRDCKLVSHRLTWQFWILKRSLWFLYTTGWIRGTRGTSYYPYYSMPGELRVLARHEIQEAWGIQIGKKISRTLIGWMGVGEVKGMAWKPPCL